MIITFGFLQLVTMDGGDAPIHITNMILMKEKGLQGILALLLFAPGLFFLGAAWRRNAPGLLLIISTMGLLALYAVADLEALEYKYVLAATIVAAPIGAAGLGSLVRGNRLRCRFTAGVLLLLMVANQVLMLRVGAQVPTNLVNAPQVDETQFWLQLQPDQPEAGWVDAIREKTPPNTIVVASQSHIHVSPFLSRCMRPVTFDGTAIAGYSVDNRYNLLSWRGYSALLYEERMATIQASTE
ncbi:MAG: hypothetical protein R2932_00345 [Caldilineaceae bacterium]